MRQSTGDNGQKAGGEGAPGLCVFLHSIFAPEKGVDLKSNPCQNAPFLCCFFLAILGVIHAQLRRQQSVQIIGGIPPGP